MEYERTNIIAWIVATANGFELNVTALLISSLTEYRNVLLYGMWPMQVEQTVDC
jgi:hypothetical protein